MIFYKNLKKYKKTTEKNITFSIFKDGVISNEDDLISKPNECKTFYNFTITNNGKMFARTLFKMTERKKNIYLNKGYAKKYM